MSQVAADIGRLRAKQELTDVLARHFVALEKMRDNNNDNDDVIAHALLTFQMPPNLPLPFPSDNDAV